MDSEWVRDEEMLDPNFGSTSGIQMFPLLDESPESEGSNPNSKVRMHDFESETGDGATYRLESERVDLNVTQAANHPMDQFESEWGAGSSQAPCNPVDIAESQMGTFLYNASVPGPDQELASEISFAAMSNFDGTMEPRLHITEDMIEEARLLASKMMGKVFYEEMENAGSPILPPLLSSLGSSLEKCVPMETFKKEATKWVYSYMTELNRKVAVHPQHIKDIPNSWRLQNPKIFYPSEEDLEEIAEDTGLSKRQVSNLFENDRKRNLKSISELEGKLKCHFPPHVAKVLRGWQAENYPRAQPNREQRQALMEKTELNNKQIIDWFNNHRVGRIRSKKRRFEPRLQGWEDIHV